jgi:2-methylcitrate dehydratase PrpD
VQEAAIWGRGQRARANDAAFTNGIAAHAFELDDYHNAKAHPGAVVVPAALAIAERVDASGEDCLLAIVIGYETLIRTAMVLDPIATRKRGWHLTGVAGTLGAAAACASLLRLDAEHTACALGLAGTQSSGLFAFNADGAMSKRFHAGRAAQAGVVAAELAARGFTGPTAFYEADDGGLLRAFSDAPVKERLVTGLGDIYEATQISFKPYSCCGSTHAYIDVFVFSAYESD